MQKIIIALDGYSGTGKSSTAQAVAKKLGYTYIDSGAMYRATTLYFLNTRTNLSDKTAIKKALSTMKITFDGRSVLLNGSDVSDEIRTMKVNSQVSAVSALPEVRKEMVDQQQRMGTDRGIVMDGRDIGTVVFPDAELKVFMEADPKIRAIRRQKELREKGVFEELNDIENNLLERDKIDSTRKESPLKQAKGSVVINTTDLSFDEQVQEVVDQARQLIYEN